MREDIAKRWVEALRSGEYPQGRNELRSSNNHYCVMGVLCDVVKDDLGLKWIKVNSRRWDIDGNDFYPSFNVLEFAGIRFDEDDSEDNVPAIEALIKYNDDGLGFDGLADVIEEFWEKL